MASAGVLFIILSVTCSLLLAHFLKLAETRKYATINVITVNYLIAVIAAAGMNVFKGISVIPGFPLWFWGFVVFVGILFISNFFLLSKSVDQNGVGVSLAAMRVSLLIPILLSILFYGEILTFQRFFGIALVFAAMIILVFARRGIKQIHVNSHWLLIGIFMFTGIADASLKIYDEEMRFEASEAHFLSAVFLVSLLIGASVALKRGRLQKMKRGEFGLGIMVGIPNLLSSIFLIWAFDHFDASVVYSVVNMMVIAGGAITGLIIWKDKMNNGEWSGVFIAILAILLLTTS